MKTKDKNPNETFKEANHEEVVIAKGSYYFEIPQEQIDEGETFCSFSECCEYRVGADCTHKDYHKDFALANLCTLTDCPIVNKER